MASMRLACRSMPRALAAPFSVATTSIAGAGCGRGALRFCARAGAIAQMTTTIVNTRLMAPAYLAGPKGPALHYRLVRLHPQQIRKRDRSTRIRDAEPADQREARDDASARRSVHPRDLVNHRLQHEDRKSTRLNSSHEWISYAVFCLKKKKK